MNRKIWGPLAAIALAIGLVSTPAAAAKPSIPEVSATALRPAGVAPTVSPTNTKASAKTIAAPKGAPPASGGVTTQARTACSTGAPCYFYVGGQHTAANTGGYANVSIVWPYSDSAASDPGGHTLVEIDAETGTGATRNIVEVGINADKNMFANDDPHLFVFWWKNGVGQGYNGAGFVNYTGAGASPYHPGDSLSGLVGTSCAIGIEYTSGNWWASFCGKWVGYFPGNSPGTSTANNLWYPSTYTAATKTQWFGEVASSYNEPCTDGGNGRQGNTVPGGAYNPATFPAYVSSAAFPGGSPTVSMTNYITPVTGKYTQTVVSGRTFYYGGPGWNDDGTATGTPGNC